MDAPEAFDYWRTPINEALAFSGLMVSEKGEIRRLPKAASTLSEARIRANRFREALRARGVHHLVIAGCAAEIEDENYFHAVFETTKGLADRLRSLSGLNEDGTTLVDRALGRSGSFPIVAMNRLESRTDQSEHDDTEMLRGLFGAFRNTTAHRPKVAWPISEADALDMMSIASLLHRRLDQAVVVPAHLRSQAA
ncbi:MAG: TIGR02391 family protein [Solirubrobacterales bacterium]